MEIWDRQKGQRSFILEAPRREIFSALLFSRDGKVLAAGDGDGAIMLWDVGTRESLAPPMNGHRRSISGLSFSNDGNLLVSASKVGVVVWDLHSESLVSHACGTANRQFDEVEWRLRFEDEYKATCETPNF